MADLGRPGRYWDGLRGLSEISLPTGSLSKSAQAEGSAKVPPKGKRLFWGLLVLDAFAMS